MSFHRQKDRRVLIEASSSSSKKDYDQSTSSKSPRPAAEPLTLSSGALDTGGFHSGYTSMKRLAIYPVLAAVSTLLLMLISAPVFAQIPVTSTSGDGGIRLTHIEPASDTLTIEVAKQKASGKLVVYVTGTDSKATLSITAQPAASGQPPIDLGSMAKTDSNGIEFFIVKKDLAAIDFVVITSTSGGAVAAQIDKTGAAIAKFYVATNGNDSWSGTLADPNAKSTNGPFATFDHARAVVQSLNKAGLTEVVIQFRGGTYFLPSTQHFAAADSGTASTRIVYQNYPGESPVFSGGLRLQNWIGASANKWETTLPASAQYFEQLFYNGVRRLRPRLSVPAPQVQLPFVGTYFRFAGPVYLNAPAPPSKAPDPNCTLYVQGSGWECFDRFHYNPGDPIVNIWRNLEPPAGNACGQPAGNPALAGDIELLDFEQYTASKLRISCVDTANQIVYLTGPTPIDTPTQTVHGFIAGHRYLVENIEDELNEPGEWFLDRSAVPWTLTYLANSGENPNTDTVIIPQLATNHPEVLVASGLEYVTFQGLTFEHDNYTLPATGLADQPDAGSVNPAVSFQNSRHIVFDSSIVTQTSGDGLEFVSCIDQSSPSRCVSLDPGGVTADNVVQNSAFYDLGGTGVRFGMGIKASDSDANVPQFNTVQNNVVEGFGRVFPHSFGIVQGDGHDSTYTHNDVYDGYHSAISLCFCSADVKPNSSGPSNTTISFNHVYNLFQGIMNDLGAIHIRTGNSMFTAAGNKVLNNKVHDVSDASALDADGYGGHGIYLDQQTGLVDVENNLVYRVSDGAVNVAQAPASPGQANTIKNNILAFGRRSMINNSDPYRNAGPGSSPIQTFVATNNLLYFDRAPASSPAFYVQGGCTYSGGFPYTQYQLWSSNLYWRTDGSFAGDARAFHVQPNPGVNAPCTPNSSKWTFYSFAGWQQQTGEDAQSVVQNPGFNNPGYPFDDFTLPKGSPGVGFVVFDLSQPGRSNPVIKPPAVPATFPTKTFDPAKDY